MKTRSKNTARFDLRMTDESREQINKLARRLKVRSESEAVRRAVALALQVTEPRKQGEGNYVIQAN